MTNKKFLYPHCGREFTDSFILRSKLIPLRIKPEERRFDVRVEYDGFDDEWYEIITCPHCYFSALDRLWEDASRVNRVHYEKQLESLRGTLHLNYQSDRDINHVLARHYLALECAAGFSISRKIRAYLWDNLRWLYWCTGDVEMLQFARNKAIDAYKETYIRDELLPNQQQYICLRIAEMLYQNGEFDDIRQWLDAVGKITYGDAKYQKLAKEMIKELEKADKEY